MSAGAGGCLEDIGPSGAGVTSGGELPNRGAGVSFSPLQEQQQMTLSTEPALQLPKPFKNFEREAERWLNS